MGPNLPVRQCSSGVWERASHWALSYLESRRKMPLSKAWMANSGTNVWTITGSEHWAKPDMKSSYGVNTTTMFAHIVHWTICRLLRMPSKQHKLENLIKRWGLILVKATRFVDRFAELDAAGWICRETLSSAWCWPRGRAVSLMLSKMVCFLSYW